MKLLFIGDIVGRPGRDILAEKLPRVRQEHGIDFVIANGENAAAGAGITGTIAKSISAYDMSFSDAIYGKAPRYVSRERLGLMLDHEYALLNERLAGQRGVGHERRAVLESQDAAFAAKRLAETVLDTAYGYNMGPVLFKPTLTVAPQTFRTQRDGALAGGQVARR